MKIDVTAAQLLVSRICHDLAGGISAVSTGAELLAEEGGGMEADSMALIATSARQSTNRLQFLRVAFGRAGGEGGTVALTELIALTHGLLEGGRVSLLYEGGDERVPLPAGKLLLNLCLIGAEALPRGGVLTVSARTVDGGLGFAVSAEGAGAALAPETRAALAVDVDSASLTARTVNAHFTAVLAHAVGAALEIGGSEGREVRIAALIPGA